MFFGSGECVDNSCLEKKLRTPFVILVIHRTNCMQNFLEISEAARRRCNTRTKRNSSVLVNYLINFILHFLSCGLEDNSSQTTIMKQQLVRSNYDGLCLFFGNIIESNHYLCCPNGDFIKTTLFYFWLLLFYFTHFFMVDRNKHLGNVFHQFSFWGIFVLHADGFPTIRLALSYCSIFVNTRNLIIEKVRQISIIRLHIFHIFFYQIHC